MERFELETMIQQMLEGELTAENQTRLKAELEHSAEARELLEQYQLLFAVEAAAAARKYQAADGFSVNVLAAMRKKETQSRSRRFFMNTRALLYVATLSTAAIALVIVQQNAIDYREFLPPPDVRDMRSPQAEPKQQAREQAVAVKKPESTPAEETVPKVVEAKPGPVLAEPVTESVSDTPRFEHEPHRSAEKPAEPVPGTAEPTKTFASQLPVLQDKISAAGPGQIKSGAVLAEPVPGSANEVIRFSNSGRNANYQDNRVALEDRIGDDESKEGVMYAGSGEGKQYKLENGRWQRDENQVSGSAPDMPVSQGITASPQGFARGGSVEGRIAFSGEGSAGSLAHSMIMPQPHPCYGCNAEDYGQYEENPRVKVSAEPLSTFGIDVDTGSYTNIRRFLSEGKLPPPASVRIEELLNYFDYDYPKQSERPFSVYYEVAPAPLDSGRLLLKLGIRAKDIESLPNPPRSLVFLVDVSGSMSAADKLPLLKQALHLLVEEFREQDRLAIVTYADGAQVLLPLTRGSAKAEMHNAVDRLTAHGSTNGGAGIDLAFDLAEQAKNPDGPTSVILATDGDFNVGNYSFDGLMRLVEGKRRSGISLNTLGLGTGNLKERNLEQLADRGNGNYYYLDSFKEAREVLTAKLGGIFDTIARDVKLQVEFNPASVREYRLIGYDNRRLQNEDFSDDTKDAGEIGAGHTVTAVYELLLRNGNADDDERRYQKPGEPRPEAPVVDKQVNTDELAYVKIRFKKPGESVSQKLEYPIFRSKIVSDAMKASADFKFAAAVVYFGEVLRHGKYRAHYTLKDVLALLKDGLGDDRNGKRGEFQRLVEQASWMEGTKFGFEPPVPMANRLAE